MRRTATLLLASTLALAAAGCGTTGSKAANAPVIDEQSSDPAVQKAVTLYKNQCLVCHGPMLEKSMSGKNSVLKGIGSKMTKEQISDKIMKGGSGMIGYKDRLSQDEVNTLAEWLSTKK
ncbi:c-type cytochrome [Gorillibacterium sp. sgz5001074]|uniref:c-type cytochrome n=1 Tax=Gorillibacterium sp. sgz5001074 TaxID=3446695 RepID=UPI003F666A31